MIRPMSEAPIPEVDVTRAQQLADAGAFVLDVREDHEWAAGHIPGATHVPLGRLGVEYRSALPTDRRIVAVCRSGARSASATQALRQAGYDVVNLAGGSLAWAGAGLPLVTDGGGEGSVA
jgi:rhodanese-related sulfurtransferase